MRVRYVIVFLGMIIAATAAAQTGGLGTEVTSGSLSSVAVPAGWQFQYDALNDTSVILEPGRRIGSWALRRTVRCWECGRRLPWASQGSVPLSRRLFTAP